MAGNRKIGAALAALISGVATTAGAEEPVADPTKGERLYRAQCATCHTFDPSQRRAGPHLLGIIGREAGSVEGFKYSKAMVESGLTWDEDTLDKYLENPRALVPKTTMVTRVSVARNRANIIAYLATKTE